MKVSEVKISNISTPQPTTTSRLQLVEYKHLYHFQTILNQISS